MKVLEYKNKYSREKYKGEILEESDDHFVVKVSEPTNLAGSVQHVPKNIKTIEYKKLGV